MAYRVIQWATGGVGRAAIEGILDHPELELVGCWVHSADKDGRDVGELVGRTPLGENRAGRAGVTGRDHHPFAFSVWAAGGGIKGGQVVGETDEIGWNVTKDPVHINDLHATVLHLLGLDHKRLTYKYNGRDFRLTDVAGNVVREVLA